MKVYNIVLTERGKALFKGGNIEVMKPVLISFKSDTLKHAIKYMEKYITEKVGSSQLDYYMIK